MYLESLSHVLSFCVGLVEKVCNYLKLSQHTVSRNMTTYCRILQNLAEYYLALRICSLARHQITKEVFKHYLSIVSIFFNKRILVATRMVKAGEILFEERPLFKGPAKRSTPICLTCLGPMVGKHFDSG